MGRTPADSTGGGSKTWARLLREGLGFTQVEVAVATGIGLRTLQRLERGQVANPRVCDLASLASFFELHLAELCDAWDLLESPRPNAFQRPAPASRRGRKNRERAAPTQVRRRRLAAGMTQQEVAGEARVPLSTYQLLEAGRVSNPGIKALDRIAAVLGVSLEDVCEDEWLEPKQFAPNKLPPWHAARLGRWRDSD